MDKIEFSINENNIIKNTNELKKNSIINTHENIDENTDENIEQNNKDKIEDIYCLLDMNDVNDYSFNEDIVTALEFDYDTNYTCSMLQNICSFYNITYSRKRKTELIQMIIEYETNDANFLLVEQRKELWECWRKLSKHSFFKKKLIETLD